MLILICGHPRAGKTTYSKRYSDVIHLDDRGYLPNGKYNNVNTIVQKKTGDVVVEGIYNKIKLREELLKAYTGNDKKVCVWLDTSLEVRRKRKGFISCKEYFDQPTKNEGWDEIIRIKNG